MTKCSVPCDERQEWNAVLASGDQAAIDAAKDRLLKSIHTRIMNDDPNYSKTGWKETS